MTTNAIAEFPVAEAAIAATVLSDVAGTVTAPMGAIFTSTTTVTWTYTSAPVSVQALYRVRLLYADTGVVLFDSGFVAGTDTSLPVPFVLSTGSTYEVEVTVRNALGLYSVPSTATFHVEAAELGDFAPNPAIGSTYEFGINGAGYMLYDNQPADPSFEFVRSTIPVEADRLATSSTPLSESVQRYLFASAGDFKSGAGQAFSDRHDAAPDAYLDSDGVDPFTKSKLTLLNVVQQEFAHSYASLRCTVASDLLVTQIGAKALRSRAAPGGSNTDFSVAAAGTISDLTSDGTNYYVCDGANVFRGATALDPGLAWSTLNLVHIGWGAGRLCGSYASSGSAPNVFTTLDDSGAEEVGSGRLVLPVGWTIQSFTAGSGHVFFCAYQGDRGAVYAWDTTTAAPFVSWELPKGEIPLAVKWSQGNVIVLAKRAVGAVSQLMVYRGEVQQSFSLAGTLVPALVTVIGGTESPVTYDYGLSPQLAAVGKFVYFSWPYMSSATGSGVGCLDLSTGGYAKFYKATVGGHFGGLEMWQGRLVMAVRGDGVWTQSPTSYVTTGWLKTSVADGNSNLDKVLDQVSLVAFPMAPTESVTVAYSLDGGNSFTDVPDAALAAAGSARSSADLAVQTPNFGLKVTLNGPGSATPTLYQAVVRYHALGLADKILQVPIDCGDEVGLLNARPCPEDGPGAGARRARVLEGLAQTRVNVQDVDYQDSLLVEVYEVVQVQVKKVSIYDRHAQKNRLRMVAVVTLRKRAR